MRTTSVACLLAGSFVLFACDGERSLYMNSSIDPSPAVAAAIRPQPITLATVPGAGCPFLTPFTTTFDLVIDHAGLTDLFLDQVTIQLSDGSNVGGSPVLMSAVDLAARFSSVTVRPRATSRFRFTPRFGCIGFVPHALHAHIVLRDRFGATRTTFVAVPIG